MTYFLPGFYSLPYSQGDCTRGCCSAVYCSQKETEPPNLRNDTQKSPLITFIPPQGHNLLPFSRRTGPTLLPLRLLQKNNTSHTAKIIIQPGVAVPVVTRAVGRERKKLLEPTDPAGASDVCGRTVPPPRRGSPGCPGSLDEPGGLREERAGR